MGKSFIITGASASGKTTLINYAIENGYKFLPFHTTRKIRENEINGKNIVSISEDEFISNFKNNKYYEPTLESAMHKGLSVYYGTPRSWKESLKKENYCASVSSPITAKLITEDFNVIWVHLYCQDKDRYKRLKERGISEDEIKARLYSGDSIKMPEDATFLIDTSKYSPREILEIINK